MSAYGGRGGGCKDVAGSRCPEKSSGSYKYAVLAGESAITKSMRIPRHIYVFNSKSASIGKTLSKIQELEEIRASFEEIVAVGGILHFFHETDFFVVHCARLAV